MRWVPAPVPVSALSSSEAVVTFVFLGLALSTRLVEVPSCVAPAQALSALGAWLASDGRSG